MLKAIIFIGMFFIALPALAADNSPTAPGASQQESVNLDAAKSFGAWYIKNGSQYADFDAAWQGWLADPVVPERFKIAGMGIKNTLRDHLSDLQKSLEELKAQTAKKAESLSDQIADAFKSTKEAAEKTMDDWINQAITGSDSKSAPLDGASGQ